MSEINIHPLQQARKKLGIKQIVLADLTGLSEPTIKRAESGKPLDDFTITAICDYFSMRYGREVKPEELGLYARWEREENLLATHVTPDTHSSESSPGLNGQTSSVIDLHNENKAFFIPPQHELLLKVETRNWSVWAGMKLMQIFKFISSSNGQNGSSEENCEAIQTLLDQEIKMLDDMLPQDGTRKEHLIARRQALIMIAALPSSASNWTATKAKGPVAEEFLPQCSASITACWHLLQEKGLEAVEEISTCHAGKYLTFDSGKTPLERQ